MNSAHLPGLAARHGRDRMRTMMMTQIVGVVVRERECIEVHRRTSSGFPLLVLQDSRWLHDSSFA